jgi:hypothetical protein
VPEDVYECRKSKSGDSPEKWSTLLCAMSVEICVTIDWHDSHPGAAVPAHIPESSEWAAILHLLPIVDASFLQRNWLLLSPSIFFALHRVGRNLSCQHGYC